MDVDIRHLTTVEEVSSLEPLLREYMAFVGGEIRRLYGIDIPDEEELARTMGRLDHVIPPNGVCIAAFLEGRPAGMVFVRPVGDDDFEIKRLYVQPVLRGTGTGRALAERAIAAARSIGARRIVLDSTRNLTDAARLYSALGFEYRDAYEASDHGVATELSPQMVFMEKRLD